ncbi:MAG: putative oxidoreductase [Acidimicrobiaceae bacterium]|nr:putative oxidoreductase [Acidimicrobiaceae bacterium]
MRLRGARALVTGCSTGIGLATVEALAEEGSEVWATTRSEMSPRSALPSGVQVVALDLTDPTQVSRLVDEIGPLDLLVNNAGYGVEGAVEEVGDEDLRAQFETNVFAPWRLCRSVLPAMRAKRSGVIVNVSSFGAHVPFPGIGAYRSSKFALEAMTWTLHLEVAHFGIRVIAIEPGLVQSAFNENSVTSVWDGDGINPYDEMRASIAVAYPRMSPEALDSRTVADRIVSEIATETGPLHVPIGEDAERMMAAVAAGEGPYHRYLVENLGFAWLPAAGGGSSGVI